MTRFTIFEQPDPITQKQNKEAMEAQKKAEISQLVVPDTSFIASAAFIATNTIRMSDNVPVDALEPTDTNPSNVPTPIEKKNLVDQLNWR